MLSIMLESSPQMLAVQATGTLTDADYTETWLPALEKIIEEYEVANALFYMDENFAGWEMEAIWEDLKFGIKHRNDFARIAIVGGPKWVHWGAKLGESLMDCKIQIFEPEKLSEAVKWASTTAHCACDD